MSLPLPESTAVWALFLDIDGTLIELAPRPEAVEVLATLPPLLKTLGRRCGGALALVSGRSLDSIDHLFPHGFDAVGCHGVEWRLGSRHRADGDAPPPALAAVVDAGAAGLPGLQVERKPHTLALHYKAIPDRAEAVRTLAEAAARSVPGYRLQSGKDVVEILPADASKGMAIARAMAAAPYAGRRPVFAGDDLTDESGFAEVNRMNGITIHVGKNSPTAAQYRVSSPGELRRWLETVNQALGASIRNDLA